MWFSPPVGYNLALRINTLRRAAGERAADQCATGKRPVGERAMDENEKTLLRLLLEAGALKFGEFTLKSGRKSPYFVNVGTLADGERLNALGEIYARTVHDRIGLDFDVVFGPSYKGIPIAVATSEALWRLYNTRIGFASDRKEEKDHGEGGKILGTPIKNSTRVVYVDDVISAGTSFRASVKLLKDRFGARLVGCVVAVDRQERGTRRLVSSVRELENEFKVPVHAILRMREVVEELYEKSIDGKVYVDRRLRDDFLAYHQATLSPYRGMRGPVVETDEYPSAEACARAVLDKILSGRIS